MTKRVLKMLVAATLLAGGFRGADAYNGTYLSAKAVSTQFRYGGWDCDGIANPNRGKLVVYSIENSTVVGADTIYKPYQKGWAHYPAFSLSGTKIAFYRFNEAPNGSGGCASVNGGKSYISVINTDGTGLTNLCELPAQPAGYENFPLDWPAGDWIYYVRPHDAAHTFGGNNASTSIWKVSAVGSPSNQLVCNLTNDGSGNLEICNALRRFTLSVAGDKMGIQYSAGGKAGCTADPINNAVNNIYSFPPANCAVQGTAISSAAGCNISISPSGLIKGSYFAGSHDALFLGSIGNGPGVSFPGTVFIKPPLWDGSALNIIAGLAGNLTMWSGDDFIGNGAESIRWSANSDKWVMQKIGTYQSGHASNNDLGSNQVVCNFIDRVAINISKNPVVSSPAPSDYIFVSNDAGDLWVSDPGNNPGKDRFEDLRGRWLNADGSVPAPYIGVTPAGEVIAVAVTGTNANDQTLQIANTGSGSLGALSTSISYQSGASNWLSATISNQQITLKFTSSSLAANEYKAMLSIASAGVGDTAKVSVALSVQRPRDAENPANAQPGLAYKYFAFGKVPIRDYDTIAAASTGICTGFDLKVARPNAGAWDATNYGYRFEGFVDVPQQGIYMFSTYADDMANLYIGSELVYSFGRGDGHGSSETIIYKKGPIALKAGKHAIRADYTQTSYENELSVNWENQAAGISKQRIPSDKLFCTSGSTQFVAHGPNSPVLKAFAATVIYDLCGRRVGMLTPELKSRLSHTSSRKLLLAVPENAQGRAGRITMVVPGSIIRKK